MMDWQGVCVEICVVDWHVCFVCLAFWVFYLTFVTTDLIIHQELRMRDILFSKTSNTAYFGTVHDNTQETLILGKARGLFSLRVEHNFLKLVSY